MKKIIYVVAGVAIVFASSCKKYLDINDNPNSVIASTPDLVLPQAIVGTAAITNGDYSNGIGADLMYRVNAGGFSGFGTVISYDYVPGTFTAAWSDTYDNTNDYKYIMDNTAGKPNYIYFNAVARIMHAYLFGMLVDQYDNIPYSQALKGKDNVNPAYDKGVDIYKSLAAQLDTGIALINTGLANALSVTPFTLASDPLFSQSGPNMVAWKQFANTVKLRLIVRAGGKVTFNNTNFSTDGFLTTDALVNPGYTKVAGKISPIFPYSATNAATASSRLPSTFVVSFYDGTKLNDQKRGNVVFRNWPNPPSNQLGNETTPTPPNSPVPNSWIKPSINATTGLYNATITGTDYGNVGIMKDYVQGVPLITAAESYFLQSEAVVRGYMTGDAMALFNKGIEASFTYLYKTGANVVPASGPYSAPAADATAYIAANTANRLANFALALTTEQKVEAIITQKFIALNMISMHEGWNEYRRTGYPAVTGTGPTQTMASTVSLSTRPDRMPTRFPYPSSEVNTNSANIPGGIDKFKTLLFWSK
ncbi:MAG: SusD/RagB family nutrient-binding outer membrane lipoprotein [Sediminibacterium sp.]